MNYKTNKELLELIRITRKDLYLSMLKYPKTIADLDRQQALSKELYSLYSEYEFLYVNSDQLTFQQPFDNIVFTLKNENCTTDGGYLVISHSLGYTAYLLHYVGGIMNPVLADTNLKDLISELNAKDSDESVGITVNYTISQIS
jgi:hypothetical protein